ncbi:inner nuclear membrane protein enriched at telomere/subtelomere region [Sorochytrium milnesiophthora]
MSDDAYWLDDDFDPNTLRVIDLRKRLSDYDVALPPSSVKKAVLVDLWFKHVYPQRYQLRLKHHRNPTPSKVGAIADLTPDRMQRIDTRNTAFGARGDTGSDSEDDAGKKTPATQQQSKRQTRSQTASKRRVVENGGNDKPAPVPPVAVRTIHHPRPRPPDTGSAIGRLLKLVLLATVAAALYHVVMVSRVGFCDNRSIAAGTGRALTIQERLEHFLRPACRPCPAHAVCRDGQVVRCRDGRVLKRRILSTPLLEFTPVCLPDTETAKRVDQLLQGAAQYLALYAGRRICDGQVDTNLSETDVLDVLRRLTPDVWGARADHYHQLALQELHGQQIGSSYGIQCDLVNEQYRCTSTRPIFPLGCRIRRTLLSFATVYRMHITVTLSSLLACAHLYRRHRHRQHLRAQIDALTDDVLDLLLDQEALHERNPRELPALSITGLKSSFFPPTSNVPHADVTAVWSGVCANIRANANIRESIQTFKGEPQEMWEWIGGGVLSPKLRKQSNRQQRQQQSGNDTDSSMGQLYSSDEELLRSSTPSLRYPLAK